MKSFIIHLLKSIQPPPPPPESTQYCLLCGGTLQFIKEYGRWYCENCKKYDSEMPVYPCEVCGRPLMFVVKYQRWYCKICCTYA